MNRPTDNPLGSRLRRLAAEFHGVSLRLTLVQVVSSLLPPPAFSRLRALLLRLVGVQIGARQLVGGAIRVDGGPGAHQRLRIGDYGWINRDCYFDVSGSITIGDRVDLGQGVMILTQSHVIGGTARRAAERTTGTVVLEDACWIGARATILPDVVVGRGAIVAAGSVVVRDVPPHCVVGGQPARWIRDLDDQPDEA